MLLEVPQRDLLGSWRFGAASGLPGVLGVPGGSRGFGMEVRCVPGWVVRQSLKLDRCSLLSYCPIRSYHHFGLGNTNWAFSFSVMSHGLIYMSIYLSRILIATNFCLKQNALKMPGFCATQMTCAWSGMLRRFSTDF